MTQVLDFSSYLFFFILGCLSGFLGSTVGSGAMLVLPVLLIAGLPPQIAIGTTKIGDLGTFLITFNNYFRNKKIKLRDTLSFSLISALSGIVGAILVTELTSSFLEWWMSICMILVLPLVISRWDLGIYKKKVPHHYYILGLLLFSIISLNSSIFPAGSVTISLIVVVYLMGYDFIGGYSILIFPILVGVIFSSLFFIWQGLLDFSIASCLFFGGISGGFLGSRFALDKGNLWVRSLLVVTIIFVTLKVIIDLLFFST